MSLSDAKWAYKDCYDLMDKALKAERGIRVHLADYNSANYFRMRVHKARAVDRMEMRKAYLPEDPKYGCSEYDTLVCLLRVEDGEHYAYIQKGGIEILGIEEITEENKPKRLEHQPMKLIEGPKAEPEIILPRRRLI